jgi:AraC-like DNA-binding protein
MKGNFKYLTTGEEDISWGLYFNVAGGAIIEPGSVYPPKEHPSGYLFEWETGRVLNEYQLIYITKGAGIFENNYGKFQVRPGSLMIIFPNQWHRYRPFKKMGWVENYIGFKGKMADELLNRPAFSPLQPVIPCGIKEEVIETYLTINDIIEKEQPGFQQIASGMLVKLLGYIVSFEKQKGLTGKHIARIIEEVRLSIRQNMENEIDLKKMAEQHNVGYSYFRKMFKKYTGMPPGQYHLQLRIIRAKELLISTDMNIKEISLELGFQSIHYFSLFFKKKVGLNPTEFRKRQLSHS